MGRYYQGDIEGKFWFGVQSSNDGEFFGAQDLHEDDPLPESERFIDYMISIDERFESVENGIKKCLVELGVWNEGLTAFFDKNAGWNEKTITEFMDKERNIKTNKDEIKNKLEWFARLGLGRKIEAAFNENPDEDVYFEAQI
jgi:hypothetical protein